MTDAERELLLYLGATIAGEIDQSGGEISAEVQRLADRVAAETIAAQPTPPSLEFTKAAFLKAVDAFATNWGDLAMHDRDAADLFREIRIILKRREEWGAALTREAPLFRPAPNAGAVTIDEPTPLKPYTVKEYADRARVTQNSVYVMVRRGEVPAVRFGRAIRIPRETGDKKLTTGKNTQ